MVTRNRIMHFVAIGFLLASFIVLRQRAYGNETVLYAYAPPTQYTMMPPSQPFMMTIPPSPLISAQQICASQTGWQWRSDGFAMCFRSGNVPCPNGYPWMRRATEHYTVCLSMENPSWVSSGGLY